MTACLWSQQSTLFAFVCGDSDAAKFDALYRTPGFLLSFQDGRCRRIPPPQKPGERLAYAPTFHIGPGTKAVTDTRNLATFSIPQNGWEVRCGLSLIAPTRPC